MNTEEYYKKLADYFRRSVIDGERLSPNTKALQQAVKSAQYSKVKKDAPFAVDSSVWELGRLSEQITQTIFSVLNLSPKVQQTNIVLIPRIDLLEVYSGQTIGQQSTIITPLIVQVVLDRSGELKPSALPPFVPREWMAPNDSDQVPFAHVETMDAFITQNPFNVASWPELQDYCDRMLACLMSDSLEVDANEKPPSIFEHKLLEDYQMKRGIGLALLEPPIIAGFHVLKIYDAIVRGTKLNGLFKKMFSSLDAEPDSYLDLTHSHQDCLNHIGQMTAEFPLANKQRNALHYISRMQKGDLIAVNGPPGTGKTTLLRSVVADAWVAAALNEEEPPVIVAASSSNQAVTNVLDSFCKVEETQIEETLKGRWLPHIDSYGLYACGDNNANDKNPYAFLTKKGAGVMEVMESEIPVADMSTTFLECFNAWSITEPAKSISIAMCVLHIELRSCVDSQAKIQNVFTTLQGLWDECNQKYGSELALAEQVDSLLIKKAALIEQLELNDSTMNQFLELWQKRSFIESLFGFLPWVKKRWWLGNELLARRLKLPLNANTLDHVTTDLLIRSAVENQAVVIRASLSQCITTLEESKAFQNKLTEERQQFFSLLTAANIQTEDAIEFPSLVNVIDVKLRFRAFKLATHYWEARWLKEMEKPFDPPRTPAERLKTYRRYAKLAPCFVSTFNMLPNFFEVSERDGDGWKSTPLVDGADLLIVDEAGQALPHIAAASFLIAKKAVLVGDIYQIEPVWSLSKGVDRANLGLSELVTDTMPYEDFWLNGETLASSGNLMKVAHRQIAYKQFNDLEKGLYLTEHRRCYDSIIHYCNKLVYQGHLEAMRGESDIKQHLPTMGFMAHESVSQQTGASRSNSAEAKFICQWIISNREKIEISQPLEQSVAIITPFSMQAKLIRRELNNLGLSGIKVGTVHTFQGAECETILFSSVYASNDSAGRKFYDRGSNMLNVAVSRAKNAFVVFGDSHVFGSSGPSSASGLLKSYLSSIENIEELSFDVF